MRKKIIVLFFIILPVAMPEILFAAQVGQKPTTHTGLGALGVMLALVYLSRRRAIGGWLLYYYVCLYIGTLFTIAISIPSIQYINPSEWEDATLYFFHLLGTIPAFVMLILQIIFATMLLYKKKRCLRNVKILRYILAATMVINLMDVFIDGTYFNEYVALPMYSLVISMIWFAYFLFSDRVEWVLVGDRWDYDAFSSRKTSDVTATKRTVETSKRDISKVTATDATIESVSITSTETALIRRCPSCGKNIESGTNKCRYCGGALKEKYEASIKPTRVFMSSVSALLAKQSEGIRKIKTLPPHILYAVVILIIGLAFVASWSYFHYQVLDKGGLESQERCAQGAKRFFHDEGYERSNEDILGSSYVCHHNKKLNKCFIETFVARSHEEGESHERTLVDVFEGKEYARIFNWKPKGKASFGEKPTIEILDNKFATMEEYEKFVKSYMEE